MGLLRRFTQCTRSRGRLRRLGLSLALCTIAATAEGAPGDTLFSDNFERAALAPWTTSNAAVSGILTDPNGSNSPTRGLFTSNQAVTVTGPTFGAAVPGARLTLWVRRGSDAFSEDPDSGEDLVIEYRRADNSWAQLVAYSGAGTAGQIFTDTITFPPDALHGGVALRARQTGGSGAGFDFWHVDDFLVTETIAAPTIGIGDCDDFEMGLSPNWSTNSTSGAAGTSAATSQSPTNSMFLNGGVVDVTSLVLDASDPTFGDVSMWIRRGSDTFSENPDGGEDLVVEYLDDVGSWIAIETFSGSGAQGQIFTRTYTLPAAARHAGFRLRFRQVAGSGTTFDFWHVDDVCFLEAPRPDLIVTKAMVTSSDPVNGTTNPKAIPGATITYTIEVTNVGPGTTDAGSMVITDAIADELALFVDTSGGDPIVFADGTTPSGLTYAFGTDVSFSNQAGGGAPFDYVPTPDAQGFDAAVTGVRVNPSGAMAGSAGSNPSFRIELRTRVE